MSNSCGSDTADTHFGLRVASLFIIMATSMSAAMFPVVAYRSSVLNIPEIAYSAAKYFGSGVIIATGFIHLLAPAIEELGSPCLTGAWQQYPWALAISMLGMFFIFFVELLAYRWGTDRLKALGIGHDPHGHNVVGGRHAAHGPEPDRQSTSSAIQISRDLSEKAVSDSEHSHSASTAEAVAQVIGVAILEFGVVLHSFLIGLTLAVDPGFKILFVVIVFHQMFEGIGVGSRLALLHLPPRFRLVPIFGALLYGLTTPIGVGIGLALRSTYNPNSASANIVSGIIDATSSGILLYTGLVELLAHEFLFSPKMNAASTRHVVFASVCVVCGAGVMSLLGRWA